MVTTTYYINSIRNGGQSMKVWKRLIAIFIACFTITVAVPIQLDYVTLTAEAHSGRTDKYGGHKDNKNVSGLGYYHYHCGGNPAHLHENGICPYADSVGTAGTSSNSTSVSPSVKPNNTQQAAASVVAGTGIGQSSTKDISAVSDVKSADTPEIKISDTSYDNVAFNASYYANAHADVYQLYGDDAKALYNHFITTGITEGRQSSAGFSILVYKENNQDLKDAFGDDLIKYYNHFIEYGVKENRVAK